MLLVDYSVVSMNTSTENRIRLSVDTKVHKATKKRDTMVVVFVEWRKKTHDGSIKQERSI